ncbi:glycosyltransferase family 2 protein [Vineibacter terrae]|uniref:Glycosyltransferase family 2 protein n=1 Tax=Vineibacter terrae TaxID=2586908 RepID=A0A5C8P7D8_9HYPH|nr:glycosyltransferase family 2 protein [Vineibacter terrae]TXL69618.1 glycosyltransferase family 2 protein [Vineibacter terrae]
MLDQITPVILTYNEAPNIGRNLEQLAWAREVVVVDSGSDDDTAGIVGRFPNARLVVRPFDSHAQQWTFAVQQTGIATPWVLRLDADYIVPEATIREIAAIVPGAQIGGYRAAFDYCIDGRRLRGSLYPKAPILFRRDRVTFVQDGHTEKARVDGVLGMLAGRVDHDDRKRLDRWLVSQFRYQSREADKLTSTPWSQLSWGDRVRLTRVLGPPLVLLYCLFGRGLILDGWPGWVYAFQRMTADLILSMLLIQRDLAGGSTKP